MEPGRSLYEILQVDPRAEPEVLEAAFRRLARKYHPDVSRTADSAQRMKELNAAYQVLRDPARRADYDRALLEPEDDWRNDRSSPAPEPEPAVPTRLTCRQHAYEPAIATCPTCGAGMCEHCFARFQPASCLTCATAWERQSRRRFLLPALWFFILLGAVAYLFANSSWLVGHRTP
jgi:curved DNA-binding protein CbpA